MYERYFFVESSSNSTFISAQQRFWNHTRIRHQIILPTNLLSLLVVVQDWDFPDFSGDGIKIVAVDFSSFVVRLPECVLRCNLPHIRELFNYFTLYVSAKWFNYFGIMMGVAFDWAYWFLTALCFRPCDYAQLWETETGFIYSITDRAFQVT